MSQSPAEILALSLTAASAVYCHATSTQSTQAQHEAKFPRTVRSNVFGEMCSQHCTYCGRQQAPQKCVYISDQQELTQTNHMPTSTAWIVISIDLGTSTDSACFGMLRPGRDFKANQIEKIRLTDDASHEFISPSLAVFTDDKWLIGQEVETRLDDIPEESVISCGKLILYDTNHHFERTRRVHAQLAAMGQSAHDLLTAILTSIWRQSSAWIKREMLGCDSDSGDDLFSQYETMVSADNAAAEHYERDHIKDVC